MPDLILHHFDLSPFAEKVRVMLGLKRLAWHSVDIPMVMPKPDLVALTGGYRKTPVLQIGADIYCDTRLIARELERRFPTPSLFPDGSRGLTEALAAWSDRVFFDPGAGLSMGTNQALIPAPVLDDRKAFFNFMDFSRLESDIPHLSTQVLVALDLIETQLADGRPFMTGPQPGLADILAYFPLWMLRGNVAKTPEWVATLPCLLAWEARMGLIGHGQRLPMTADEALGLAQAMPVQSAAEIDPRDPLGLTAPDDYGRVPVQGTLHRLTRHEVAVKRHDERAGTVAVHFPRGGYRVERAPR
jgi:glutathione S-transferase